MKKKLEDEAKENGLAAVADVGENKFLRSEMYSKLGALMNRMNMTWSGKITSVQIFIPESYTYDKNGNLLSKESALKSEKYSYNSQNRLCESVVIDR